MAIHRNGIDAWSRKLLTAAESQELLKIKSQNAQTRYLANRFSVKEAIYKACFPHFVLRWKDVAVISGSADKNPTFPKPHAIILNEKFLAKIIVHISISHEENEYVISTATVEKMQNTL